MRVRKRHGLIYWLNVVWGILLCSFSLFMVAFSVSSIRNLMVQEVENRSAILKLNVDHVDGVLENLEKYFYLFFRNSENVVRLETGGTDTEMFMATQGIVDDLTRIAGWNDSLQFLFYYVPESPDKTFIKVSANQGMVIKNDALEERVKEYIEEELESGNRLGKGYLLVQEGGEGYLIRFYKVRNSYIGMCLNGDTVLMPLEELTTNEDCLAFICNLEGTVISATDDFTDCVDISENSNFVEKDKERYLQLCYLSAEGDFYIGTWTKSVSLIRQMHAIKILILGCIAGFLLFLFFFVITVQRALCRPIQEMDTGMKKVGDGEWDYVVKSDSRVLEYDNMIRNFNEMVSAIKNLKIKNYEKELDIQKSYLQYLQMQVNPHFYLNALNIIYSLAQVKDYKMIQEMTMSLVEYSRYMFRSPKSLVTVQQEMEHVENYIKIQRLRFPDRMEFVTDISSEAEEAMIPPFIIQTFVENSIKYAVNFEQHNLFSVKGTVIEDHEELYLLIEIRDNGRGYQEEVLELLKKENWEEDSGKNVGIRNVRQRLKLVFGDRAKMILKNEEGAVSMLFIPLCLQEDEVDGLL
ncbi:MAG: histidine kinase [Ruminococcus flavefaciens]|nr:histidine kinase [Ruminococcus flavefaciens]